jgi:CxxC-x17-CxxC domain-containing protein
MNNFKKGGFRQGGNSFGGRSKFSGKFKGRRAGGDRSGGRLELFPAVCFECKKECEVPFRPTGDKPVYCRDCFGKQKQVPGRNSNGRDRLGGDFRGDARPQREYQPEYARVPSDSGADELKQHLIALESKVDRILELVSRKTDNSAPKTSTIKENPKVIKATKVKVRAEKTEEVKAPNRKVGRGAKK